MSDKTKRALSASLKKALETRPLDKITVTDITDGCNVKRQTFYYHFKDVFDLITWTYRRDAEDFVTEHGLKDDSWDELIIQLLDLFNQQERNFILATYNSKCHDDLVRYLEKIISDQIRDTINREAGDTVPTVDRDFITAFYTHAFVGTVMDWVGNGMKEIPSEIIGRLNVFVSCEFQQTLNAFAKKKAAAAPRKKTKDPDERIPSRVKDYKQAVRWTVECSQPDRSGLSSRSRCT